MLCYVQYRKERCIKVIQVTNIQDLKKAVNQNGEMVITMNNNDIVIMKMEDQYMKILKI